jgi:hypothetical protein
MALQEATFDPALQNSPVNLYNQRSVGSTYATTFPNVATTLLLAPDIRPDIVPSFPTQFTDMAFFMSLKKRPVKSLEYNWFEEPWIHVPLGIRAGVGATAPVANTVVTQVVPITDNAGRYVRPGDKVIYPDGTNGVVFSMVTTPGAMTITVNSLQGAGLPALTTADTLRNVGPMRADGYSTINSTTITEVIGYNNILENSGAYARRWDRLQKKEWQLSGTTDYIERDLKNTYLRAMTTWQARLMMSQYGRTTMPDGVSISTSTRGLLQQQADAGVTIQNVAPAQAADAVREIVFDTSLQAGGTKVLLGTRRNLQLIGQMQKADKVRYTPSDTTWNMDIYQYQYHGHTVIEVPMDQWEDPGLYGDQLRNDLLVLNKEDLFVNYFEGEPMISRKHTLLNVDGEPGNLFNFDLVWYEGLFGFEMDKAWATGRLRIQ